MRAFASRSASASWLVAGLVLVTMQAAIPVSATGGLDGISVFMGALALLCAGRTVAAMPEAQGEERWRLWAAAAGWLLWATQWGAGAVEFALLSGDQTPGKLLILMHRVAFIVALLPLAPSGDGLSLRALDMVMGAILASLLALLTWPGMTSGVNGDPDATYLHLSYATMTALAAMGMATQRPGALRGVAAAMVWTFLLYGASAVLLRVLYARGVIAFDSRAFMLGDAAFLAYLLIFRTGRPREATGPDDGRRLILERLAPLFLTGLILALAFVIERQAIYVGLAAGLLGVLTYAVRIATVESMRQRAEQEALAAERVRSRTIVDMMHEVRSPLGTVMLNAGLLGRSERLGEGERAICRAMETGCRYVSDLLGDVLTLERLEAGAASIATRPRDVTPILAEVVEQLASFAHECGVAVARPGETPFLASVDAGALRRILLNLVANAIRFTARGGHVVIEPGQRPNGMACLAVRDDGIGIPPELVGRLFQRFAVTGEPVHGARGTGLGLSISLSLARAMGGTIEVASHPGRGTTMTVVLRCPGGDAAPYTEV